MDFSSWLQTQRTRQDFVGQLAEMLLSDPMSPLWSNRLATYRSYLIYCDSDQQLSDALTTAFEEWRCRD